MNPVMDAENKKDARQAAGELELCTYTKVREGARERPRKKNAQRLARASACAPLQNAASARREPHPGNPPRVAGIVISSARRAASAALRTEGAGGPHARVRARAVCTDGPRIKKQKSVAGAVRRRGGPRGRAGRGLVRMGALRRVALGAVADSAVSLARSLVLAARSRRSGADCGVRRRRMCRSTEPLGEGRHAPGLVARRVQPRAPPPPSFTAPPLSRAQRPVGRTGGVVLA